MARNTTRQNLNKMSINELRKLDNKLQSNGMGMSSREDTNELIITEFSTRGTGNVPETSYNGNYYDWIEIYNPGVSDVNLNGWKIENSTNTTPPIDPQSFFITDDINVPAGGYFIIMADDCDDNEEWPDELGCYGPGGPGDDLPYELDSVHNIYTGITSLGLSYIRAEMKLGKGCNMFDNNCNGESITLYSPDGQISSYADYFSNGLGHPCDSGYSYARVSNTGENWQCRCGDNISFGFSNNGLSDDDSSCGGDIKLYINEFMSKTYDIPVLLNEWPTNTSGELSAESDYLEIYNPGPSNVDLFGWYIDVGGDDTQITQHHIINVGEHLIAIANKCDPGDTLPILISQCVEDGVGPPYINNHMDCPDATNGCSQYLHLPGKISDDESMEIRNPDNVVVDSIEINGHPCDSNCAYSRIYDGYGISGILQGNGLDEGWECRCEPGSDEANDYNNDLLSFGFTNGTNPDEPDPPTDGLGDVNQDGAIDVLDVVMLVQAVLGYPVPEEFDEGLADLNDDGNIDVLDVVTLVTLILGPMVSSGQLTAIISMIERLSTKRAGRGKITQCNDPLAFNYNRNGIGCNPRNRMDNSCCNYYIGNMRK